MKARDVFVVLVIGPLLGVTCSFLLLGAVLFWQSVNGPTIPIGWLVATGLIIVIVGFEVVRRIIGRPTAWIGRRMPVADQVRFFVVLGVIIGAVAFIAQQGQPVPGFLLAWLPFVWYFCHLSRLEAEHQETD